MTKDEALRLALEALEECEIPWPNTRDVKVTEAITAIKAALEANEFNPDWDTQAVLTEEIQRMAKRIEELEAKDEPWEKFCDSHCVWSDHHPDCKLAKDEPVATICTWHKNGIQHAEHCDWDKGIEGLPDGEHSLYTTPPQRTWVGLTKEDMPNGENPMFDHEYFIAGMVFAAKILEEKNT
jgi:hypothetical protein